MIIFSLFVSIGRKWKKIFRNVRDTSPDIHNEVIEVFPSLVKKKLDEGIRKMELVTIMADGTTI